MLTRLKAKIYHHFKIKKRGVKKSMERSEIDKLAYRGEELPNDSNIFDEIYWLAMYYLYKTATLNNIPAEQSAKAKSALTQKLDKQIKQSEPNENVIAAFNDSVRVMREMEKFIRPYAEFEKKSREELIEFIKHMFDVLSGLGSYEEGK